MAFGLSVSLKTIVVLLVRPWNPIRILYLLAMVPASKKEVHLALANGTHLAAGFILGEDDIGHWRRAQCGDPHILTHYCLIITFAQASRCLKIKEFIELRSGDRDRILYIAMQMVIITFMITTKVNLALTDGFNRIGLIAWSDNNLRFRRGGIPTYLKPTFKWRVNIPFGRNDRMNNIIARNEMNHTINQFDRIVVNCNRDGYLLIASISNGKQAFTSHLKNYIAIKRLNPWHHILPSCLRTAYSVITCMFVVQIELLKL